MIEYWLHKDLQLLDCIIFPQTLLGGKYLFLKAVEAIVILTWNSCRLAASSLRLCVSGGRTDFVRWRSGFRGSFTVHSRAFHAIFTFLSTLTLSPYFSLKCWYLLLVISSSWHNLLFSFIRGEQWYIFCTLCRMLGEIFPWHRCEPHNNVYMKCDNIYREIFKTDS